MLEILRRQNEISRFIQNNDVKVHQEILDHLEALNIDATQSTISRDLEDIHVKKVTGFYRISKETIEKSHKDQITSCIENDQSFLLKNVSYYYLKTGKDNASVYAYHLKELFPRTILDLTLKEGCLIMLVNLDAEGIDQLNNLLTLSTKGSDESNALQTNDKQ